MYKNSIIFFFENYFEKDNKDQNDKLPPVYYKKKCEENFQNIKKDLNQLKENGIYDYKKSENIINYLLSYMTKKKAIDFLFSQRSG